MHETETIKKIHAFLENNTSLYVEERDGWLFAVKEGNDPEAGGIAFRADMDALPIDEQKTGFACKSENPGVSHKCGHDGHCAALAGLALELDKTEVSKTVYLIFQCAEEIGAGAVKASAFLPIFRIISRKPEIRKREYKKSSGQQENAAGRQLKWKTCGGFRRISDIS